MRRFFQTTIGLALVLCAAGAACAAQGSGAPGAPTLERTTTPLERYQLESPALINRPEADYLALAAFCREHQLVQQEAAVLKRLLRANPEQAEARERLGFVRDGKKWVEAPEVWRREARERERAGEACYGEGWIPKAEAEAKLKADANVLGWAPRLRLDTQEVRIFSGAAYPTARALAEAAAAMVPAYRAMDGASCPLKAPRSVRVCLFEDRKTWAAVYRKLIGEELPDYGGSCYHDLTDTVYICMDSLPALKATDAGLAEVIVHEMVHALDEQALKGLALRPKWLEEGRAEYLGHGTSLRRIVPGAVMLEKTDARSRHLGDAVLKVSLAELLDADRETFYSEKMKFYYPLSWALVHFLLHGENGRHAEAFRAFVCDTERGWTRVVFEARVGKLAEIEPAFKRYVREVFLPLARASQTMERK